MSEITQAELSRYAQIEQRLEELESEKAGIRARVFDAAKAAVAAGKVDKTGQPVLDVEPGSLRVKVRLGDKAAPADWKVVKAVIEEKNCTYINGGGKIRQLNDILDDIVEKSRGKERVDNNSISVKPNIPSKE